MVRFIGGSLHERGGTDEGRAAGASVQPEREGIGVPVTLAGLHENIVGLAIRILEVEVARVDCGGEIGRISLDGLTGTGMLFMRSFSGAWSAKATSAARSNTLIIVDLE
ncbi:unnamed protein product [Sphagnum balticum]